MPVSMGDTARLVNSTVSNVKILPFEVYHSFMCANSFLLKIM